VPASAIRVDAGDGLIVPTARAPHLATAGSVFVELVLKLDPGVPGSIAALPGSWQVRATAAGELVFSLTDAAGRTVSVASRGAGLGDGAWHALEIGYDWQKGIVALLVDGEVAGWVPAAGFRPAPPAGGLVFGSGEGFTGFTGEIAGIALSASAPRGAAEAVDAATGFFAGDGSGEEIRGRDGADSILGRDGGDLLLGLGGDDRLDGGEGRDAIFSGSGDDAVLGHDGDDLVRAADGDDSVGGGDGADILLGGRGADRLDGGTGDDLVQGSWGADSIAGGQGNDRLRGGDGADRIEGGAGDDRIDGGAGADVIAALRGGGRDIVAGFQDGLDRIDLSGTGLGSFAALRVSGGANAVIDYGTGSLVLLGIGAAQIDASDFVFV
jgi:Ca2+-binding RTX toxin-like protein